MAASPAPRPAPHQDTVQRGLPPQPYFPLLVYVSSSLVSHLPTAAALAKTPITFLLQKVLVTSSSSSSVSSENQTPLTTPCLLKGSLQFTSVTYSSPVLSFHPLLFCLLCGLKCQGSLGTQIWPITLLPTLSLSYLIRVRGFNHPLHEDKTQFSVASQRFKPQIQLPPMP